MRAAPTGREREYDALVAAARDATAGHGSIVFLAGRNGTGKSALIRALTEELDDDELVESSIILPPPESTIAEVGEQFHGEGLIPD